MGMSESRSGSRSMRRLLFGAGPGGRSHAAKIGGALHPGGRFDLAFVDNLGLLVSGNRLKGKLDIVSLDSAGQFRRSEQPGVSPREFLAGLLENERWGAAPGIRADFESPFAGNVVSERDDGKQREKQQIAN